MLPGCTMPGSGLTISCYSPSMVRIFSVLLTLCLFAAPVVAEPQTDGIGYIDIGYERCLRIRNERSMLRCMLRKQRLQAILEANDRYLRQRALEHSTPEGRAVAVERLLRAHRERTAQQRQD